MIIILSILVVLVGSLLYFYKPKSKIPAPQIHGRTHWFKFPDINKIVIEASEYSKKFSRIYVESYPFFPKFYVVHEPNLIKEMTIEKANEFLNHSSAFIFTKHSEKIPGLKSLFFMTNDEWRRRRKAMSPFFTSPKILPLVPIFRGQSNVLCGILSEKIDQEIDMHRRFSSLTVDILGESVLSVQFNSQKDPTSRLSKAVDDYSNVFKMSVIITTYLPYWYKYPFKYIQNFTTSVKTLSNLCRQLIEQRQVSQEKGHDLLQALFDLGLDMENGLIPEVFLFFFAGHETTSNLLCWSLFLIAQHPDVESKMREEIRKVIGDGEPTSENIESLEYMDCVIHEVLRLYPPAIATDREANVDVTFDGHLFSKGSRFFIPIMAIHHNEKYWTDPKKFDPTRFDSEHKHNIQPFTWLPFGSGPRICIGSKFVFVEAKVVLAKLFQKYTFELKSWKAPLTGGLYRMENLSMIVHKIDGEPH